MSEVKRCEICGSDKLYEHDVRDGDLEFLCWKCDRSEIDDIEDRRREREEEDEENWA